MDVENTYSNIINNELMFNITYLRDDNKEYIKKNISKISKEK